MACAWPKHWRLPASAQEVFSCEMLSTADDWCVVRHGRGAYSLAKLSEDRQGDLDRLRAAHRYFNVVSTCDALLDILQQPGLEQCVSNVYCAAYARRCLSTEGC